MLRCCDAQRTISPRPLSLAPQTFPAALEMAVEGLFDSVRMKKSSLRGVFGGRGLLLDRRDVAKLFRWVSPPVPGRPSTIGHHRSDLRRVLDLFRRFGKAPGSSRPAKRCRARTISRGR